MASNITPVSTFDTAIPVPDPGDEVRRTALTQFAQPLANRSEYLKGQTDQLKGILDGKFLVRAIPGVNLAAPIVPAFKRVEGGTGEGYDEHVIKQLEVSMNVGDTLLTQVYVQYNWATASGGATNVLTTLLKVNNVAEPNEITATYNPSWPNYSPIVSWQWPFAAVAPGDHYIKLVARLSANDHFVHVQSLSIFGLLYKSVGAIP